MVCTRYLVINKTTKILFESLHWRRHSQLPLHGAVHRVGTYCQQRLTGIPTVWKSREIENFSYPANRSAICATSPLTARRMSPSTGYPPLTFRYCSGPTQLREPVRAARYSETSSPIAHLSLNLVGVPFTSPPILAPLTAGVLRKYPS